MSREINFYQRFSHSDEGTKGFEEIEEGPFNIWFDKKAIPCGPFTSYGDLVPDVELVKAFKSEYGDFPPPVGCHRNSLRASRLFPHIELMCGIEYPKSVVTGEREDRDKIVHSYNRLGNIVLDFTKLRYDGTQWHDVFMNEVITNDPINDIPNNRLPVRYIGITIDIDLIDSADIDSGKTYLLSKQYLKGLTL